MVLIQNDSSMKYTTTSKSAETTQSQQALQSKGSLHRLRLPQ